MRSGENDEPLEANIASKSPQRHFAVVLLPSTTSVTSATSNPLREASMEINDFNARSTNVHWFYYHGLSLVSGT